MFDSTTTVTLNLSDNKGNEVTYGGKDSIITSMDLQTENNFDVVDFGSKVIPLAPSPIKLSLEILIPSEKYYELYKEGNYSPKISQKKVKDCSIQELLFAVRKKIK